MTEQLRILTVCTHNRTRSVAMKLFLQAQLRERRVPARVMGAGFVQEGLPPTGDTIAALAAMGLDANPIRSRVMSADLVAGADLIVCAERQHVVRINELDPASFARTFTLPELVQRAEAVGPRAGQPVADWLALLNTGRTRKEFLTAPAIEVADPTGMGLLAVGASMTEIGDLCLRLAALL